MVLPKRATSAVLLGFLLALFSDGTVVNGCTTDEDCLLLGVCAQGVCQCRQGFTGPECGQLDFAPAPVHLGYRNISASTWGGLPVQVQGQWHMYVSMMRGGCPLGTFNNNSEIVHLVSEAGWEGPYSLASTVVPSFAHNAAPRVLSDGSVAVWYIGYDGDVDPIACPGGVAPPNDVWPDWTGKQIGLVRSQPNSPDGPWSKQAFLFPHSQLPGDWWKWDCSATNPSALVDPTTGAVRMLYRGTMCTHCDGCPSPKNASERLGIATAPSVDGPYTRPAAAINLGHASVEDPFYWRGANGSHHLIAHSGATCRKGDGNWCGVIASSADGMNWRLATAAAYGPEVVLANGTTVELFARQRPQLVFDLSGGVDGAEPALLGLANGAQLLAGGSGSLMTRQSFTLLQPVKQ